MKRERCETTIKHNTQKGFTLVELIVVIAILAILALILVPTMTGLLDDSRDAVCLTNRGTVKRAYTYAYTQSLTNDEALDTNTILNAALQEAGENPTATNGQYKAHCGGTVTVTFDGNGLIATMECNLHNDEEVKTAKIGGMVTYNEEEYTPATLLRKIQTDNKLPNNIDSTAPDTLPDANGELYDSNRKLLEGYLSKADISLSDMAVQSWSILGNGKVVYISDVDISKVEVGTKVRVIRYNDNPAYKTYTATYITVKNKQYETIKDKETIKTDVFYNAFDSSDKFVEYSDAEKGIEQTVETKKSFEETAKIFNEMPSIIEP